MARRAGWFAWFIYVFGAFYFILPLFGTFIFSLQKTRGAIGFSAYAAAFANPGFLQTFLFSCLIAALTILASLALIVPTAFWVNLRMPKWRGVVEFITLLPFVIPAIVLVFGIIKTFGKPVTLFGVPILPSLLNTELSTNLVLVGAYTVLSLPYMYRATDNGLRAMDVRTLAEAAQSLGANWFTVLTRVIIPNLRTALLSGSLLTFAIVIGEYTIAAFLARPMFGPYLQLQVRNRAYEAAALTIVAFALTWIAMGVIDLLTRGRSGGTIAGAR
jgi:putative spermidine/putrescine transport system permease protein